MLAESVWGIIRREGFDAASVRAVAAEAGLSPGSVRHFFATQDALHIFAMEELIREIGERVEAAAATGVSRADAELGLPAVGPDPSPRQRVLAVVRELLPLTEETTDLYRAHLQFVLRSTVHSALAPVAVRTFDELRAVYRQLLTALFPRETARSDATLEREVRELGALLDGIVLQRLVTPQLMTVAQALDLVESHLDRVSAEAAR